MEVFNCSLLYCNISDIVLCVMMLQARVTQADLDPRIVFHYGIPTTASILALDRTQSLLAIGTL